MCGVNEKFIYYTRRSRTCNTDSGIVRWTRNAASAFKQTLTEYHQPKKSQLPIKSNANIFGLGFYPVIINKDQLLIRTYLSKIPLDKAKNREK